MPDQYKSDADRGLPTHSDPSRGYKDPAQQRAQDRASARDALRVFSNKVIADQRDRPKIPAPVPQAHVEHTETTFHPRSFSLDNQVPNSTQMQAGTAIPDTLDPLWTVQSGPASGGGNQWQLLSGFIYDGIDATKELTISNLSTNVSMDTTSGDWLYLELPVLTSPSYPTYGTLTVKAAGSTTLPGGGFLEYAPKTISGQTVFAQTFLRLPLAKCVVSGGSFKITTLQSEIKFIISGTADMYDSSGGTVKQVGGVICL